MNNPPSPKAPPPPTPPVRETSFAANTIASDARRQQAKKKGVKDTIFAGENPTTGSNGASSSLANRILLGSG